MGVRRSKEAFEDYQLSKIESALIEYSEELVREGLEPTDALMIASSELDGAAEGKTILSPATCSELGGKRVRGLTGSDSVTVREDDFAESEFFRHRRADQNRDEAARWLAKEEKRLSKLSKDIAITGG